MPLRDKSCKTIAHKYRHKYILGFFKCSLNVGCKFKNFKISKIFSLFFSFYFFFTFIQLWSIQGNLLRILSTVWVRLDLWYKLVRRPWTQKHKRSFWSYEITKICFNYDFIAIWKHFFSLENVFYRGYNLEIPYL